MKTPEFPRLIYSVHGVGTPDERTYDAISDNFTMKIVDAPILLGQGYYRYQAIGQCRKCRKYPIIQNWKMPKLDKNGEWLEKPNDEAVANILGVLMQRNHTCPVATA